MKPETYKAAIYKGIGKVEVANLPYPVCGDDDVIVKNLMGGICGADINAYLKGGDPHMIWKDHEFGHEMISEVVETGKNVTAVNVGDWVWPHLGYAHRDRRRMATVGGFSEYIRIVQYEEGYTAFKLNKNIPADHLVLLEPFIIGARGAKNADPGPGKTVIVFGAGVIGLSCAIMLKYYGCEKVMIVDMSEFRLKNAAKFGLIPCNSGTEDLKAKAMEVFGSQQSIQGEVCGADVFIDCIGIQPVLDDFAKLARRGATLVIVGVHHKPATMNFMHLCYGQWNIKGCGSLDTGTGVKEVIEMMQSGKYDLSSLISHKYPVDQIEDALKMAANANESQRVIISFV
jgi:threonine dehydrogenase-like Zn-dependent dehydrogenase